jgi:3-hydroxybutyryl-CoA dehydrogenase
VSPTPPATPTPPVTDPPLPRRVCVIGAGTMGHGIAQIVAAAGCEVHLVDRERSLAEAGLARLRENLGGAVARGKLDAAGAATIAARVSASDSLEDACRDAELVIEAVPEDLALKQELLARIEPLLPDDALLASNTSSLSLTRLQSATARPERVVGLHFFNPVHIMALLEIVQGERTAPETIARALAFGRRLGKEPIVVRDSPGFATSRLGIALGNEAMRLLDEGVAAAADIDKAMELGYRHPMGPLRLSDLVGLDVRLSITRHLFKELRTDTFRPPRVLERLVSEGKLGRKTGQGFYVYGSDGS